MNLQLEPRETAIQDQWRQFAREAVAPFVEALDTTGECPQGLLEKLRGSQLLQPFLPVELGGEGLGLFPLVLGLEELAKVSPVIGILVAQQVVLGIRGLGLFSAHPARTGMIKEIAGFGKIISLAATEVSAGSDLSGIETTITGSPEAGFAVKGGKAYVNWAGRAGYVLLLAGNPAGGSPGKTLVCVSLPRPGVTIGAMHKTMGLGGIEAAPLDIQVEGLGTDDFLGVFDFGRDVYDRILNEMRIAMATVGVGLSQMAFDEAATHAKARKQYGKPIGSFQSLQWRFADAATRIEAARLHAWRAVEMAGSKLLCAKQAAMAKIFATETAFWMADFAVQVLGSKGFLLGNPVERLFRDSRFLRIGHGTSEVLRNLISTQL